MYRWWRHRLPEENKVKNISVHVIGAVANPGVYELPADARVTNAVNMANPLGEADLHALKLAAKIVDGQDIYVPYQGERDGPVAAGNQLAAPGCRPGRFFCRDGCCCRGTGQHK
ncbi:MAG: hypothetical protein RQM92_03590 [Candidatus Syntrophopropionicum ammoniitolerans]